MLAHACSTGGGLALHKKEDGCLLARACDPGWEDLASVAHALEGPPAVAAVGGCGVAVWEGHSLTRLDAYGDLHWVSAAHAPWFVSLHVS